MNPNLLKQQAQLASRAKITQLHSDYLRKAVPILNALALASIPLTFFRYAPGAAGKAAGALADTKSLPFLAQLSGLASLAAFVVREPLRHFRAGMLKEHASVFGKAGQIERLTNVFFRTLSLAALPATIAQFTGAKFGTPVLHKLFYGSLWPVGYGMIGANILASIVRGRKMSQVMPTPMTATEAERRYSKSGALRGVLVKLRSTGAITPGESLLAQLLGLIEAHTSVLPYLHEEKEKKESGAKAAPFIYQGRMERGEESGIVDTILDRIEFAFSKIGKYDPLGQIFTFLFTGKTPRQVQKEMERVYGPKETRAESLERKAKGIFFQQQRLVKTSGASIADMASGYEGKMLALQIAIYDVLRFSLGELVTIRAQGHQIQEQMIKVEEDRGLSGKIRGLAAPFRAVAGIPGLNAIFNLLGLLARTTQLPFRVARGARPLFERVRAFFTGGIEEYIREPRRLLKEAGIYKTAEEKAYDAMAYAVPEALEAIRSIGMEQLEVQQNIYRIQAEMLESLGGISHAYEEFQRAGKEKRVWSVIAGQYLSKEAFEKEQQLLRERVDLFLQQRFKRTPLGDLFTYILGRGAREREKAALERILNVFLKAEKRLFGYTDLLESQFFVDLQGRLHRARSPLENLIALGERRAYRPRYGMGLKGREVKRLEMEMKEPFFYLRARIRSALGALGGLLGFPVGGAPAAGAGFGGGFLGAFRFFAETQRRLMEAIRKDYEERRRIRAEAVRLAETTGPVPAGLGVPAVKGGPTVPTLLAEILEFLRSLGQPQGPCVNVRLACPGKLSGIADSYLETMENIGVTASKICRDIDALRETSEVSAEAATVSASNMVELRKEVEKSGLPAPVSQKEVLARKYEEIARRQERREMTGALRKIAALLPVPREKAEVPPAKEDFWSSLAGKLFKWGAIGLTGMAIRNMLGRMFAGVPFLGGFLGEREFAGPGEKWGGIVGTAIGAVLGLWFLPFAGPLGALIGAIALGPLGGRIGMSLQDFVESRFGRVTWSWEESDPNSLRNVVKASIYGASPVLGRLIYEHRISTGALVGAVLGASVFRVPLPLAFMLGALLGAEAGDALQRRFDPQKILGEVSLTLDTREPTSIVNAVSAFVRKIPVIGALISGEEPSYAESLGALAGAALGLRWFGPYLGLGGALVGAVAIGSFGEMVVKAVRQKLAGFAGVKEEPLTDTEKFFAAKLARIPGLGLLFGEGGFQDLARAGIGAALGLGLYFKAPVFKALGPIGSVFLGMAAVDYVASDIVSKITAVFEGLKGEAGGVGAGIAGFGLAGLGVFAPAAVKAAFRSVPVMGAALSVIFDLMEGKTDLGQIVGGAAGAAAGAVIGQALVPIPVVGAILGAVLLSGVGRWVGDKISGLLTWQTGEGETVRVLDVKSAVNQLLAVLGKGLSIDGLLAFIQGAGVGGAVGAVIGQFLIPIPGVGAGVGAILGAGVGSLIYDRMAALYQKVKDLVNVGSQKLESFKETLADWIRKIPGLEGYHPDMSITEIIGQAGIGAGVGAIIGKVLFGPILGSEIGGMLGAFIFGAVGNSIWQMGKDVLDSLRAVPSAVFGQRIRQEADKAQQSQPQGQPYLFENPLPIGGPTEVLTSREKRTVTGFARGPARLASGGPDEVVSETKTAAPAAATGTTTTTTSDAASGGLLGRFAYELGYALGSALALVSGKEPEQYAPPGSSRFSLGTVFSNLLPGTSWLTSTSIGVSGKGLPLGGTTAGRIMTYLVSQGFTPEQAAGILGNLEHESGLRTTALGDKGTSYGLAQWHAGRWENLKRFAAQQGKPESDLETQLKFLIHELNTSESAALEAVRAARTPEDAAYAFARKFERPAAYVNLEPRAQAARRYLDWYQKGLLSAEALPTRHVAGFDFKVPSKLNDSYAINMFSASPSGTVPPLDRGYVITDYPRYRTADRVHKGYDMVGKAGDPVYAMAPGIVTFTGNLSGYDNLVVLHHPQIHPMLQTRYAHLATPFPVSVGQGVNAGDVIGKIGGGDRPHLHVEARLSSTPEIAGRDDPVVDVASLVPNLYTFASEMRERRMGDFVGGPDEFTGGLGPQSAFVGEIRKQADIISDLFKQSKGRLERSATRVGEIFRSGTINVDELKRELDEMIAASAPVATEVMRVVPEVVSAANVAAKESLRDFGAKAQKVTEHLVDQDMRDLILDLFSRATVVWKREYENYAYRNTGVIDI